MLLSYTLSPHLGGLERRDFLERLIRVRPQNEMAILRTSHISNLKQLISSFLFQPACCLALCLPALQICHAFAGFKTHVSAFWNVVKRTFQKRQLLKSSHCCGRTMLGQSKRLLAGRALIPRLSGSQTVADHGRKTLLDLTKAVIRHIVPLK